MIMKRIVIAAFNRRRIRSVIRSSGFYRVVRLAGETKEKASIFREDFFLLFCLLLAEEYCYEHGTDAVALARKVPEEAEKLHTVLEKFDGDTPTDKTLEAFCALSRKKDDVIGDWVSGYMRDMLEGKR